MRKALVKLALGAVLGLGAMLGLSAAASAQDYVGDCSSVPNTVNGIVYITDSSCTISHDVTATGWISINVTSLNAQNLTALGGSLGIASSGSVTVNNVYGADWVDVRSTGSTVTASSLTSSGANVLAEGQGNVAVSGTISASTWAWVKSAGGEVTVQDVTTASSDITIQGKQGVTASDTISSAGAAYIRSEQGDIEIEDISVANNNLQIIADDGKITANGDVTGSQTTLVFNAKEDISLQNIENNDGYDVRIFANTGGGASPFTIGTGSSNGVASIHNNGSSGVRTIYISNGDGAGGIQYSGNNSLQVQNSSGQAGFVILDGRANGNVTLSGTLSVDGAAGQSSGHIVIFAPEIISNGATLSANSPGQATGFVNLFTSKVTTNSGLTISVNGTGSLPSITNAAVWPVGSFSYSVPADPGQPITPNAFTTSTNPVQITGAGALTMTTNGNNSGAVIRGYGLTINNGGGVTVTQQGAGNLTWIGSSDGGSSFSTATFGTSIQVHANTTASGQAQNEITISGTPLAALAQNVLLDAAGHSGGPGSKIFVYAGSGTVRTGGSGAVFTLNANGSGTGGDAGTITISAATLHESSMDGILAMATGGNGKGGTVDITATTVELEAGDFVHINASGAGSGKGGDITISSSNFSQPDGTIQVSGGTTDGAGGDIAITVTSTVTVGTSSFLANGHGSGDGGSIHFSTVPVLNLQNASLRAIGGSDGLGGVIVVSNTGNNDVNQVMKVDGGVNIGTSDFDGSITINAVECRQWKTTYSWPKTYWDCVDPESPNDEVAQGAALLPGAIVGSPGNLGSTGANVQVYRMIYLYDYARFFDGTTDTTDNILGHSDASKGVAAAFGQNYSGTVNYEAEGYYRGTIVHELGHVWDGLKGNPSTNGSLNFIAAVNLDVANFNALTCTVAITNKGADPSWCTGLSSSYTNYEIYQMILGIVPPFTHISPVYTEAWGRAFGHQAESGTANPGKHVPAFVQNVEETMSNVRSYMSTVFSTGAPY